MKKIITILTIILVFIVSLYIGFKYINYDLKIVFFDVLKADSILITYKNTNILIDTGLEETSTTIIDYLNKKNIKKIDYVILTHYDKDHIGGIPLLAQNIDIGLIIQNSYIKESKYYDKYISSTQNINKNTVIEDYKIEIDDLKMNIMPSYIEYSKDTSNNSSLIISLEYKNNSFLFASDIKEDRINDYIKTNNKEYDLLKLPHHGKYNESIISLLNNVKPKYGIITNNNYDLDTIDILNKKNIKYYITDKKVLLESDGNNIKIKYY